MGMAGDAGQDGPDSGLPGADPTGFGSTSFGSTSFGSTSFGPTAFDPPGFGPAMADPWAYQRPVGCGLVTVAILLTIFLPMIALFIALAMRTTETAEPRRRFLKNWAIGSAASWLCTGWLIAVIAFSSAGGGVGTWGCRGGIDQLTPPTYISSDGKHWTATYTCENGGTTSRRIPRPARFPAAACHQPGPARQPDLASAAPIRRSWTVAPPRATRWRLAAVK